MVGGVLYCGMSQLQRTKSKEKVSVREEDKRRCFFGKGITSNRVKTRIEI